MHQLTLYHAWRSSCSWRVRWALAIKGLSYEGHALDLAKGEQRSAEFRALNPTGQVPCLVIDGCAVGESLAILEWLEEVYPDPPLLPSAPLERLRVRRLCQMIVAGIQPLQSSAPLAYYAAEPDRQRHWAHHWISRGFGAIETELAQSAGTYCVGSSLSLADICLVPQAHNARERYGLDLEAFPTIAGIYRRCIELSGCRESRRLGARSPNLLQPQAWRVSL